MTKRMLGGAQKDGWGRRDMLAGSVLGGAGLMALGLAPAAPAALPWAGPSQPFAAADVVAMARSLAAAPYAAPPGDLPAALSALDYDAYRQLRFDRANLLRLGPGLFAEPLIRGGLFPDRVDLHAVERGQARRVGFDRALFDWPADRAAQAGADAGYSGFRLLAASARPGIFDELAVFQGASYFRSFARGQGYGLSARALAIGTGGPAEEFPRFRAFWLEPAGDGGGAIVHALIDSPSLAGALRMTVRPGTTTVMEVDARLFPRVAISAAGVAPASSMFLFAPGSARRFDDFRAGVHDSDGLEMWTGAGERLWRPLADPAAPAVSAFADRNPRGFGLMQRARARADYQDLEARYERRPSLWVEPLDRWGAGAVQLVELPTVKESDDNIAMFWRPAEPWPPGREQRLRYRLHWTDRSPAPRDRLEVVATRTGSAPNGGAGRHYAIDFGGPAAGSVAALRAVASASAGTLSPVRLEAIDGGEGAALRASFDLAPPATGAAELRLTLVAGARAASETWLARYPA